MKKTILRFAIATTTFAILPAAAHAQVGQVQPPATQQQEDQKENQRPNQQQRPGANRNADSARGQAPNQSPSQQNDKRIEQLVANKLLTANKGVVELSKMAVENANDDKVKEFAQTLVSEHESLCRDIEKLQAASGHTKQADDSHANQSVKTRSTDGSSDDRATTAESTTDQASSNPNRANQQGQPANRQAANAQAGRSGHNQGIVGKLQMINDKASKKQLEMAKEMLKEHKGKDFDMAFVGMQVAAHTTAVAELSALEGVGSKEMQDVVNKAEEATSKHLKKAKDLANELSSK